jgi:hypothetical protein
MSVTPEKLAIRNYGIFIHDRHPSYDHMMWEFEAAYPKLQHRGLLGADDVFWNSPSTILLARQVKARLKSFVESGFCARIRYEEIEANFHVARLGPQKIIDSAMRISRPDPRSWHATAAAAFPKISNGLRFGASIRTLPERIFRLFVVRHV